eukprot:UN00064
MDTPMPVASSSKLVAAMALYETMAAGHVRMDDKVSKYIDWWTKNETDSRSGITLRHLVSFSKWGTQQNRCARWILKQPLANV